MRKLSRELENPVDNVLLDGIDKVSPIFKALNFTPNMLTTLSLIFGLGSVSFLLQEKYITSACLYFVSYFFDCFDGNFARRYKMVSQFGDYYDHIKDVIIFCLLYFSLYLKYKTVDGYLKFLPLILVPLLILMMMNIGCQEKYFNKTKDSQSLKVTLAMCPAKNKEDIVNGIQRTKNFTAGTFALVTCFLIALCHCIS